MVELEGVMKDKGKIYLQIICSVIVTLMLFCSGIAYGWMTIALPDIRSHKSPINVPGNLENWVVCAISIGGCFGPFLSALLLDRIGRKWFLYLTSVPFIVCWVLTFLAKSWVELLLARFIVGLSVGALCAMVPVYLGEIVETNIRGGCSTLMALMLNLGYIFIYGVGPLFSGKILTLICLAPVVVFLLTALWLPESPYFYIKKNKEKCAALTLVWLRRRRDNSEEIEEIKKTIEAEKEGGFKQLFVIPAHRRALLLLLLLLAGQQLSGYMAIQSYSSILFNHFHLRFSTETALLLISGIALVSSVVSSLVVDRFGRKVVYLVSAYTSTLCLVVIGVYFLLAKIGMKVDKFSLVPLISVGIYVAFFAFGLASIPATVSSEIFPICVKSWATTIANAYGSALAMIVGVIYKPIVDRFGYHAMFLGFALIELIITIVVNVIMPETSRKSFKEIQDIFDRESCNKKAKAEVTEAE
ncbi:PREDICTED: facilitated trehalose transporter Tret1-like isoform X2 [Eufriesea mexicana]|nr:PREDICTED: facilitated trehalose transporter Tret1-like isoform X2 [Eufriesea mexicana]